MFKFFKKQSGTNEKKGSSDTDEIRKCAKTIFITPARQRGDKTVTFSASDVCGELTDKARFQTICTAIDAKKFSEFARVKLIKRTGPKQGAAARWIFGI